MEKITKKLGWHPEDLDTIQNNAFAQRICTTLFLLWIAVVLFSGLIAPEYIEAFNLKGKNYALILTVLVFLLILLGRYLISKHAVRNDGTLCGQIFLTALALRLILLPGSQALPTSDLLLDVNPLFGKRITVEKGRTKPSPIRDSNKNQSRTV